MTPVPERWRALVRCWDSAEGYLPGACLESEPRSAEVVFQSPLTFSTCEAAMDWAYAHDIDITPSAVSFWQEVVK